PLHRLAVRRVLGERISLRRLPTGINSRVFATHPRLLLLSRYEPATLAALARLVAGPLAQVDRRLVRRILGRLIVPALGLCGARAALLLRFLERLLNGLPGRIKALGRLRSRFSGAVVAKRLRR